MIIGDDRFYFENTLYSEYENAVTVSGVNTRFSLIRLITSGALAKN